MNARKSNNRNVLNTFLAGALLATLSFNAVAESELTLDARAPLPATLLPSLRVSASISNPSAEVRWSIAPGRPIPVTLMPTLTVTPDATAVVSTRLPVLRVVAQAEATQRLCAPAPAQIAATEPPMLGVSN